MPNRFAVAIAECRSVPVERRRELLMRALQRRPGDFTVLMNLGLLYAEEKNDRTAEQTKNGDAVANHFRLKTPSFLKKILGSRPISTMFSSMSATLSLIMFPRL